MAKYLLILLTLSFSVYTHAQENNESVIVLELFTSQGCSSCPPADVLLDDIKETYSDQNVFVLSYHVDYWNRLGWKDPFSAESFSDYQRDYAQQFYSRSIYTPQLVVNGSEHFTGSNGTKAEYALKKYSKSKATNAIKLTEVKRNNNEVILNYAVNGDEFNRVTLALVVSERITEVRRGENRNRTLKNSNIVANRLVKKENSGEIKLIIPDWIQNSDELSVIAYTQDKMLKTTGAVKIEI
ncbi:DUF1223 domain-containing protein [Aquimarina sp. 2201CG5-10]|uniref:DUF1223 domain-containing protein n=1 Tax=Aquimarina callyspongiae TaxID=3098150 RepID=UPI002AB46EBA|nr:DUF1223 domain-containing protein [Aquimarina sp. 2201CG5-10]MDY8138430.1 DUF1223 domain-containing protein [Aquimarina sp. 2201CG5-10]